MSWSLAAVLIGAGLLGTGFGAVQNASLATMYDQVDISSYAPRSALRQRASSIATRSVATAFLDPS